MNGSFFGIEWYKKPYFCVIMMLPHIKIKNVRKSKKISQQFMADKLNISQFAYSKIERGITQLNWDKLNKVAQILEINVWELVDNTKASVEVNPIEKKFLHLIDLVDILFKREDEKIKSLNDEIVRLKKQVKKTDS